MTREHDALCSIIKNENIDVLFSDHADDLFEAYGDVLDYMRKYYSKYRVIPGPTILADQFNDFEYKDIEGEAEYYVEKLKAEFLSNKIEELVLKASEKNSPEMAERVLSGMQKDLSKLNKYAHSVRDIDIMDFDEAEKHYAKVRQRAEEMGGVPGIATGIGFIDSAIPQGIQDGDLVTIMGYPARGKSALGTLLASNLYARGHKTMIVSMEMTAASIRDRLYTIMGSGLFKNSELSIGVVGTDSFRDFKSRNDRNLSMPVVEGSGSPVTPNMIQAKINEHKPRVVIIDYLQLLHDNGISSDMTARIRQLSLELKGLAVANRIPFIVIASATPTDNSKVTGPPSEMAIAWSKQVSYDSAIVIAIHKFDDTDIFEILMTKNRWGPLSAGYLKWDIDNGIAKEFFDLEEII